MGNRVLCPIAFAILTTLLVGYPQAVAVPIRFQSVEASFHSGPQEDLNKTIDGLDASPQGWSVSPRVDEAQAAVFVTETPIEAELFTLTMFFMSGRRNSSFASFSVRYTTDPKPSLKSQWEDLPMLTFGGTACNLRRGPGNRLLADEASAILNGQNPDNIYWISTRARGKAISGFRIDIFPVSHSGSPVANAVAWSKSRDFVLTEFKAEILSTSTNIALGTPVTATHPLYSNIETMYPAALTDGWPSTIAHPASDISGQNFFFEIDLGEVRELDHIGLRQRGDAYKLDRFAKMRVKLFEGDPKDDAPCSWQVLNRADGSYAPRGEVDILRKSNGAGTFRGRYLRISSENPVPLSPMLAEVEVYETRTARLLAVTADGRQLPATSPVVVPPGVLRLGFRFDIPRKGQPYGTQFQWRLQGVNNAWQPSDSMLLEFPCPPAGVSTLEIQTVHSDGQWDQTLLLVKLNVQQSFTHSWGFLVLMASGALGLGALVPRAIAKRQIARLKAQAALSAERARIARDMHDEVGARLSQLSFMAKALAGQASLPADAREELAQITGAASEALGSLDEVVWTINPKNDRLASLSLHLCNHATRYLSPLNIACRVTCAAVWPELEISASVRRHVSMAFTEALQNVAKHSQATEVRLSVAMESGHFVVRLCDNGCGLPENAASKGRSGLENMRTRLAEIGGTCQCHSPSGGGTEVEICLPLG